MYIVECSDGTLYSGWSTDPARRVAQHNSGTGAKYTRGRRPVRLVYVERVRNGREALRRESQIKKMSREAKRALCLASGALTLGKH